MKKTRLTLAKVNAEIQAKYPGIELVRGKGYFYIDSKDEALALKIAGLYTSSIYVNSLNQASLEQWMKYVEFVLIDGYRFEFDRSPVF